MTSSNPENMEDIPDLDFHEVQKHVLRELGYRNEKTFSEVQGNWDSSKLSFHLKQLREKGLVEKNDNKYRVTPKGKGLLADIKFNRYRAPINLLNLIVFSPEGKVYMTYFQESMDPLAEFYRPIVSRVLKGEVLEDKAKRLFEEKFGYEPEKVERAGTLENILWFKEDTSQHYVLHNMYIESEETGENFRSLENKDFEIVPGMRDFIKHIRDNQEELPFMGRWDVIEKEKFELKQLEIE